MFGDLANAIVLCAWKFQASTTKRALAPPWAQSLTVATGDAVICNASGTSVALVASTGGTTASGGAGPTGVGPGLSDGTVTWVGYPIAGSRIISVINMDPSVLVSVGDVTLQLLPVPPSYGSVTPLRADPSKAYVIAASGTPTVAVVVAQ